MRLPRLRRRWVAGCAVLPLAILFVAALLIYVFADPAAVGRFRSPEGERAYRQSYANAMKLLPAPSRTLDVRTGYGTVRVYEFLNQRNAQEVPIVLLPGRTSGVPMWASNLPGLAAHRTVYALDALGDAGLSVQMRAIENSADQAAWLEQCFAELGLGSTHLAGHSFGGWLAANYAARYPKRVRSLSLLEPVFVFQGLRWQVYAVTIPASLPFLPRSWRDAMLAKIGGVEEIDRADPMAQMIADATEHFSVNLPLPDRISDEQLRGLPMPVYAVLGGKSFMHNSARAAEVARSNVSHPGGELAGRDALAADGATAEAERESDPVRCERP